MCPVGALTRKKNGIVWLDKDTCIGCQACVGFCPINAMRKSKIRIEPFKCISCGACIRACPEKALEFLYTHDTSHFLIDSTDIGKYSAFSSIGSVGRRDRIFFFVFLEGNKR